MAAEPSSSETELYLLLPTFDRMDEAEDLFIARKLEVDDVDWQIQNLHAQADAARRNPDIGHLQWDDDVSRVHTTDEAILRYTVLRGGQPVLEARTDDGWKAAPYLLVTRNVIQALPRREVHGLTLSAASGLLRWHAQRREEPIEPTNSLALVTADLYRLACCVGTPEERRAAFERMVRFHPERATLLMEHGWQYYDGDAIRTVRPTFQREDVLPLLSHQDREIRSRALLAVTGGRGEVADARLSAGRMAGDPAVRAFPVRDEERVPRARDRRRR